ncbi:MAG: tRNA pseudouridine(13) synthase TruD [Gammaproteobacteria bacterium]|nr:tRNA pseudouridine(13) synthase TruD [Gammaproteobacteria bacterium]
MKIAKLLGNSFRLRIRNLSEGFVSQLKNKPEHYTYFINYSGSQRFGLPNQVKNTHLIGKAIVLEQYNVALNELLKQSSETKDIATHYLQDPELFFQDLIKTSSILPAL